MECDYVYPVDFYLGSGSEGSCGMPATSTVETDEWGTLNVCTEHEEIANA